MLLKNIEMLVTKIEIKEGKEKNKYIFLNMVDMVNGDMFEIIEKDMELLSKFKPFTKVIVNLNLTNSKYGLNLKLDEIIG